MRGYRGIQGDRCVCAGLSVLISMGFCLLALMGGTMGTEGERRPSGMDIMAAGTGCNVLFSERNCSFREKVTVWSCDSMGYCKPAGELSATDDV